jgi:hypothetical protein
MKQARMMTMCAAWIMAVAWTGCTGEDTGTSGKPTTKQKGSTTPGDCPCAMSGGGECDCDCGMHGPGDCPHAKAGNGGGGCGGHGDAGCPYAHGSEGCGMHGGRDCAGHGAAMGVEPAAGMVGGCPHAGGDCPHSKGDCPHASAMNP